MDEFIVWDEDDNRFVTLKEYLEDDGHIVSDSTINEKVASFLNHYFGCETFRGIGKTDINGNKIYAESSIVEYLMTYTDNSKSEIKRGIFTYNNNTCSYDIQNEEKEQLAINSFWVSRASNFKVIGNLQQHKHLQGEK